MHYFSKFLLLLLSIFSVQVHAIEYGLDAKFDGVSKISYLQMFSERCSGSNYIADLIYKNLEFYPPKRPYNGPFGHKHFPPSFEIPLEQYNGPEKFYTFKGNEDALFVVIFRNPYDWLRSLHLQPHHTVKSLHKCPFSEFIRNKWQLNKCDKASTQALAYDPFADRDPITGKLFNVMKLRTSKIRTMLEIKNRVNNIYFVNYETVLLYPEEVIDEISTLFNLRKKGEFAEVDDYKGKSDKGTYTQKKYDSISHEDLNFINDQLDPELERLIGYEPIMNPSQIP